MHTGTRSTETHKALLKTTNEISKGNDRTCLDFVRKHDAYYTTEASSKTPASIFHTILDYVLLFFYQNTTLEKY